MDNTGEAHRDESATRTLGRRALIVGGAAAFGATVTAPDLFARGPSRQHGATVAETADRLNAPPAPRRWSQAVFGQTSADTPMVVWRGSVPGATERVLVVSGIHGYERITHPLAVAMRSVPIPAGVDCWIVPSANPDGWFAGTRRNARGIDLNRNFSWRWRPSTGGPRSESELETQALMRLVMEVRPTLAIWIHQPLGFIAAVGDTPAAAARPWAEATQLPVRVGMDQHGGGETWTNRAAGFPSLLVEVDTWGSSQGLIDRHLAGWAATLASLDPA